MTVTKTFRTIIYTIKWT